MVSGMRLRLRWSLARELMVAGAPLVVVSITNMVLMWTDLVCWDG